MSQFKQYLMWVYSDEKMRRYQQIAEENVINNRTLHREILDIIKAKIDISQFVEATIWEIMGSGISKMSLDDDNFKDEDFKKMYDMDLTHLGNYYLISQEIVTESGYVENYNHNEVEKQKVQDRFNAFLELFPQIQAVLNKAMKKNPHIYIYLIKYKKHPDIVYIGSFLAKNETPNFEWLIHHQDIDKILLC